MLTERQIGYVTKAVALVPTAAQPAFRQQVAVLLGYAQHPMHDRTVLDVLRPLLAEHGLSVGELLSKPPREYARYERKHHHAASPVF
jgi:hypothetical protein